MIGTLDLGGSESQLLMLVRELTYRNVSCEVFALNANGLLRGSFEEIGVKVHCGQYSYSSNKVLLFSRLAVATAILWRHAKGATVLHAWLPLTNFLGVCAGSLAGVDTLITSRRALGNHQEKFFLWKWFDRFANSLSDYVVVNSFAVAEDTVKRDGIVRNKLVCIYNGLEVGPFQAANFDRTSIRHSLNFAENQIVLITIANLIRYKGHEELINAVAKLTVCFPNLVLMVVGQDRGIGDQLRTQALELNLSNRVQWFGQRRDIPELLAAADIYVCSSHEEGFSNSLLEALGSGKAVVATRVGGNPEMLEDGNLGVLCEAGNSEELATALYRVLKDKSLRERLGKTGSEAVASLYGVKRMTDQYIALYNKV